MATIGPGGVRFEEAIRFFRAKTRLPTQAWTDLWEGMHARAFVVAGATKDSLLADFQSAIQKALEQGTTLEAFRKDFDRIVAAHGWSYRGGRNWRSAVIYNTNLRMATAAGRWEQIQRLKDRRPYLRYVGVLDNRIRPEHESWHGTVLPVDHAWWHTHYPPNGWNCRCSVMQLSQADLDRNGWKVTEPPPAIAWEDRTIKTADGGTTTLKVPKGIDTGFGYNVGIAGYGRGADRTALEAHGKWEELQAPGAAARAMTPLKAEAPRAALAKRAPPNDIAGGLERALDSVLGGAPERIFTDPAGERVRVSRAIIDHILADPKRQDGREAFFPLIPELIEDPAEILVGFARSAESGRVELRRRYVRLIALAKDTTVALVADRDNGAWSGFTFLRGEARYVARLRRGAVVAYRKS